jgi:hypothetical protein
MLKLWSIFPHFLSYSNRCVGVFYTFTLASVTCILNILCQLVSYLSTVIMPSLFSQLPQSLIYIKWNASMLHTQLEYICVYIYIHIYIHTYILNIHIYIHTCNHIWSQDMRYFHYIKICLSGVNPSHPRPHTTKDSLPLNLNSFFFLENFM